MRNSCLFALGVEVLDVDPYPTHDQLMDALSGHILQKAMLVGKYQH